MQNAPSSEKTKSKNTELKKWLPAIMLAIILHLIVVIAFLMMQKQNNAKAPSKATADNAQTSTGQAAIEGLGNADGNTNATEAMLTITESTIDPATELVQKESAVDALIVTGSANEAEGIDVDTGKSTGNNKRGTLQAQTSNKSTIEDTAKDKQWLADRQLRGNKTLSATASSNQATGQATNISANLTPLTTGANTVNNMESNGQTSPRNPNRNPNEGLLLPRDSPKPIVNGAGSSNTVSNAKDEYNTASQEIEAINDRLSQTINAVKERKMRQIQQDTLREQTAHAQDQANELQSQVTQVGQQLDVDRLAEKEFATVNPIKTTNTPNKPADSDKPPLASP